MSQDYTNAEAFVERLGARVRSRSGNGMLAMCPVHGDLDTPSLSVRYDGAFNCFSGACSIRGWSFVNLARACGVPSQEAKALVESFGLPMVANRRRTEVEAPTEVRPLRLGRWRVNWKGVGDRMRRGARTGECDKVDAAAAFLFHERRISPRTLDFARVGVDRETGEIIFPQMELREETWVCIGISTRKPDEKLYRTHFEKRHHLWLPPWMQPDPGESETLPGPPLIVLVEGQIDALMVRRATYCRAGTSLYGSTLSDEQQRLLTGTKAKVVLFLDNDTAGVVATTKLLTRLGPHVCDVVTKYHGLKDAGDMNPDQVQDSLAESVPGTLYLDDGAARHRLHLIRKTG